MNNKPKDTDLREALHRKYGDTPKLPADFMASMQQRMDAKPMQSRRTTIGWLLRAACLLIVIGVAAVVLMKENQSPQPKTQVAVAAPRTDLVQQQPADSVGPQSPSPANAQPVRHQRTVSRKRTQAAPKSNSPTMTAPHLHYASDCLTTDTLPYQDPARVDGFIAKLAAYHNVRQDELTCSNRADSTMVSAVYVFPDTKEIDLFSRLLQVVCWYSDETPGYFLNFSHQQFFFQLKDLRQGLHYLWIAERLNGKILLYASHVPIGTTMSSDCYQEYREQMTHTRSITPKTKDI